MAGLDRFCNRYYFETKFMEEELPLWIWESGSNGASISYQFTPNGEIIESQVKSYSNTLFKPYEWFTDESTPNYFVIDLYAISTGGYSSYRNHKKRRSPKGHKYDDYYSSGGSGGCVYIQNLKIRLKDEDQKGITYIAYGLPQPQEGVGGDYDWDVKPRDKNWDPNDFCIKLSDNYRTPTGIAPAGTLIFGMGVGGNAYQDGHPTSPGHGCSVIHIPEQCAFPEDVNNLPAYTPETSYTIGMWIRYETNTYKVIQNFTATNWSTDSKFVQVAPVYNDGVQYKANDYLWYHGNFYKITKDFQGDPNNTILGFADYFLLKAEISFDWRRLGNDGQRIKNRPHSVPPVPPTRYFSEADINNLNEFWVRKSLGWGQGQGIGSGRKGYWGQPGGIAMIYKGESS